MGKQYNLDYLNSISGGDDDFVKDMVNTFITNAPNDIQKIREFYKNANWPKVGEDAHRFASSLLFLGLEDLKVIATEIEELGLNNTDVDKIKLLLDELEDGCLKVITELKQDFK